MNESFFDLNTAVAFLPVMDDTENVTKQLIASIEVYNSMINEESKPQLINFILKSRLSEGAKLRLSSNYLSVPQLIADMKNQLLPKKSFTTLQQQLTRSRQNDRNIEDFGKEIENLFVELTISQADGDATKHKILKPINETLAINQFITGLRNSNLRNIISARNYTSLKDVIQGAKDQETAMFSGVNKMKYDFSKNNNPTQEKSYQDRGSKPQLHQEYCKPMQSNSPSFSYPSTTIINYVSGNPARQNTHSTNQGRTKAFDNNHPFNWKDTEKKVDNSHHSSGKPQSSSHPPRGNAHGGHSTVGSGRGGGHFTGVSNRGSGYPTGGSGREGSHSSGGVGRGGGHSSGGGSRGGNHSTGGNGRGASHSKGESGRGGGHSTGGTSRGGSHSTGGTGRGSNHSTGGTSRGGGHFKGESGRGGNHSKQENSRGGGHSKAGNTGHSTGGNSRGSGHHTQGRGGGKPHPKKGSGGKTTEITMTVKIPK